MNMNDWPMSVNIEDERSLTDAWGDIMGVDPVTTYHLAFATNSDFVSGVMVGAGIALGVGLIWASRVGRGGRWPS
jgi:hypothetical protein